MKFYIKLLLLLLLVITSCKSKKNIVENNEIQEISTKKIINNHYQNAFDQQTINARLNAKYRDKRNSVSISIKLRMEKDKTIWMSATKLGIPFAKVKITPTEVGYYEKLNRTYFEGDFSLLSKWLSTELDFEKVQNLLLGEAFLDLKDGRYNTSINKNGYELSPKKDHELYSILFFLNPENFKLDKQEIRNSEKEQLLAVSYPNYQEIEGEQIPKNMNISATDSKNVTTINIEYRSVEFNRALTFPFAIPSGYKEIILK